jgi:molybdopterin-guanine dinucleotide biosynthesis protein A
MSGPGLPVYDAVVLAGGRSSRLGGTPKASLRIGGATLLEITCGSVAGAERIVVVGPDPADGFRPLGRPGGTRPGPVRFVREDPPFSGPAAALAAALAVLTAGGAAPAGARWVMVLACDMPRSPVLVPALLEAAAHHPEASVVAREGGRDQPLAGLYLRADLEAAAAAAQAAGGVGNLSMKALLARVSIRPVPVPPGTTLDVDTWADARALGVDAG